MVKPWPAARPVPELEVSDLDGKPWKLEAHAGKVVVLNFWATWCEPCRLEMPSLDAMALKLKPQGLVVCAINYKESAEMIRQFLERMPFKATILLDPDGDAASDWTPRVFPSTRADRPQRQAELHRRRRPRLDGQRRQGAARAAARPPRKA